MCHLFLDSVAEDLDAEEDYQGLYSMEDEEAISPDPSGVVAVPPLPVTAPKKKKAKKPKKPPPIVSCDL